MSHIFTSRTKCALNLTASSAVESEAQETASSTSILIPSSRVMCMLWKAIMPLEARIVSEEYAAAK
jgi:hypothetical protein